MRCYIISSLIVLVSCQPVSETCSNYTKGFLFYMDNIHQQKLQEFHDDVIFYLIPLDGCDPCIEMNMAMLDGFPTNKIFQLVYIGTTDKQEFQTKAEKLKTKFHHLEDPNKEIQAFETNFGKPLLIHFQDRRCVHYEVITDLDVEKANAYLQTVLASN